MTKNNGSCKYDNALETLEAILRALSVVTATPPESVLKSTILLGYRISDRIHNNTGLNEWVTVLLNHGFPPGAYRKRLAWYTAWCNRDVTRRMLDCIGFITPDELDSIEEEAGWDRIKDHPVVECALAARRIVAAQMIVQFHKELRKEVTALRKRLAELGARKE